MVMAKWRRGDGSGGGGGSGGIYRTVEVKGKSRCTRDAPMDAKFTRTVADVSTLFDFKHASSPFDNARVAARP
jgi:hypothetical protein